MKKIVCFLLLVVLVFPQSAFAQSAKALRPLLPALSKSGVQAAGGKCLSFELGNMYMYLPPAVMSAHGADLWNTHISAQLDPALYGAVSKKNNAYIFKSLQRFTQNYEKFHAHSASIVGRIQSCVYTGDIPYAAYLPKDLKTLYLGEVHGIVPLAEEVTRLIQALPKLYPGRKIYLATEFLPAYEQLPLGADRTVTRPEEIAQLLPDTRRVSVRVLYAAVKAGIPVIGLERENELQNFIVRTTRQKPTDQMYEDFSCSFEGVRLRNKMWAQYLRALRQQEPDALIVVYAGFGHVGYNQDFNLPSMLGGDSFVVLFTVPEYLTLNNPLFIYFREEAAVRAQFHSSPRARLVESWVKPSPYKKILGSDMTVILQSEE